MLIIAMVDLVAMLLTVLFVAFTYRGKHPLFLISWAFGLFWPLFWLAYLLAMSDEEQLPKSTKRRGNNK